MATNSPKSQQLEETSKTEEAEANKRQLGWFWFIRSFQYDKNRDTPSDARNVLLIVAALITAVTFQAGVNPPGGVWQDDAKDGSHTAGRAIYASHKKSFYVFLIFNTLALSSAILVIISLTYRFPFHFEIWVATISMIITYGSAIFGITPSESVKFRYILITAAGPFVVRFVAEVLIRSKRSRISNNNPNVQPRCSSSADPDDDDDDGQEDV